LTFEWKLFQNPGDQFKNRYRLKAIGKTHLNLLFCEVGMNNLTSHVFLILLFFSFSQAQASLKASYLCSDRENVVAQLKSMQGKSLKKRLFFKR
jgi:hypothetical protein